MGSIRLGNARKTTPASNMNRVYFVSLACVLLGACAADAGPTPVDIDKQTDGAPELACYTRQDRRDNLALCVQAVGTGQEADPMSLRVIARRISQQRESFSCEALFSKTPLPRSASLIYETQAADYQEPYRHLGLLKQHRSGRYPWWIARDNGGHGVGVFAIVDDEAGGPKRLLVQLARGRKAINLSAVASIPLPGTSGLRHNASKRSLSASSYCKALRPPPPAAAPASTPARSDNTTFDNLVLPELAPLP